MNLDELSTPCRFSHRKPDVDGYVQEVRRIRFREYKHGLQHRFAYEDVYGPIPPGLQIDHICRNRSCCEPSHLEAVTSKEHHRRTREDQPLPKPKILRRAQKPKSIPVRTYFDVCNAW